MQTVTNPFQEIIDRLSRVESNQEKLMKSVADPSQQSEEELPIDIKSAAKITGLAIPTIYSKFCRREIPGYKRGQRLYFYKSELLDWIRSGKRSTLDEIKAAAIKTLER